MQEAGPAMSDSITLQEVAAELAPIRTLLESAFLHRKQVSA